MDLNTSGSPDNQINRSQDSVPYVTNLRQEALNNTHFFASRWTSKNMQYAHMSIPVATETGLDVHYNSEQFFYIEQGEALAIMGFYQECLDIQAHIYKGHAIIVPAGIWHNVVNISNLDLKMYTIYAPAFHNYNTVYNTQEEWFGHYEY